MNHINVSLTPFAETYMPLKRPLVPMHLFLQRDFSVLTTISAVGGMLYYALNGKSSLAQELFYIAV